MAGRRASRPPCADFFGALPAHDSVAPVGGCVVCWGAEVGCRTPHTTRKTHDKHTTNTQGACTSIPLVQIINETQLMQQTCRAAERAHMRKLQRCARLCHRRSQRVKVPPSRRRADEHAAKIGEEAGRSTLLLPRMIACDIASLGFGKSDGLLRESVGGHARGRLSRLSRALCPAQRWC